MAMDMHNYVFRCTKHMANAYLGDLQFWKLEPNSSAENWLVLNPPIFY